MSHKIPVLQILALFATLLVVITTGCSSPDSVVATARENANTPVFYDESGNVAEGSGRALPEMSAEELAAIPSFIRSPHFSVLKLDLRSIASHPDFADVPWSDLEKQYAAQVGEANAVIENVESVWLLLDGTKVLAMEEGSTPWTIVIQYDTPVDTTLLEEARAEFLADIGDEPEDEELLALAMDYHLFDESTLVIGSEEAVDVVVNGARAGNDMVQRFATLDTGKDVAGLVTIAPIRSTLQSFVDIATRFGGEEAAKFSDLPEVVHSLEVSMDLDEEQLLKAVINIEDDELGKELTRLISGALNSAGNGGGAGAPGGGLMGSLGGMAGGFPGMGVDDGPPMLEPSAGDAIAAVGREIRDRDLIEVRNLPGEVVFTMGKPDSLKEAVIASVEDGYKQFEMITRAGRMEQIGIALESYYDDHGCLPPAGPVTPEQSEEAGVPPQLNWRTALLPYLDEQELHDRFDYSLPWDDESNLATASAIPDVFATEATLMDVETDRPTECRIFVPSGEGVLYKGDDSNAPTLDAVSDRTIWTAVVVEAQATSAVPWTSTGAIDTDSSSEDDFGVAGENGILMVDASFKMRAVRRGEGRFASALSIAGDESFTRRDFIPVQTGFDQ